MNGDVSASGKRVKSPCACGGSNGPHHKSLIVFTNFKMICSWRRTRYSMSFAAYTYRKKSHVDENMTILPRDCPWSEAGSSAPWTKDSGSG